MQLGAWRSIWRITILSGLLLISEEAVAQCSCGPDFCLGDPRYTARLTKKKNDLKRNGYSAEMIGLLDKADGCFAAIDQAPDIFSLMTVRPNGYVLVTEWSDDNEQIARRNLQAGRTPGILQVQR